MGDHLIADEIAKLANHTDRGTQAPTGTTAISELLHLARRRSPQ